ncbi:MAG TPA: molybdate ABC transporter substrate-binding protein [Terriglobales bacterium]|nr:molybdate ABC transporter substrate-binding protein [Terriglobales bacterium]
MFQRLTRYCTLLLVLTFAVCCRAADVFVAAAADLAGAFKQVAARYEARTGNRVVLSLGSSGNLFAQIQNGAPYDLFFSADVDYAQKLVESGAAEPGSLYRYATGRIVVWAPKGSPVDPAKGLGALTAPGVRRIAIANPAHAPYGRAAMAALERAGIKDEVAGKIVLGENVAQAAQFAETGNADAGIIALSLALAPAMKQKGSYALVPQELHPPIEQAAVILKGSRQKEAARSLIGLLQTPEIRELMSQYGLQTSDTSSTTAPPARPAK